jgi:tRNA-dihydrouridine synthase B
VFESLTLRGRVFQPAVFCAPMAGITHSAFRRLVAGFGGYGALFTEMLSAKALLNETFANSPYVRRRPEEGPVIYQLLISDTDRLDAILERVRSYEPAGLDVNLACAAREIRMTRAGAALFDDAVRMQRVLDAVRGSFDGPLTVKIRLGHEGAGWQEAFAVSAAAIRNSGVDGVILHPRFTKQKLRSHARHESLAWASGELRLPMIVSGDLTSLSDVESRRDALSCAEGLMIGRMAAAQPWVFAQWNGSSPAIDHGAVWMRLYEYVAEDFAPGRQLARVKIFTEYFSRNFRFGHTLFSRVQSASSMEEARGRAAAFFAAEPAVTAFPSVRGIS